VINGQDDYDFMKPTPSSTSSIFFTLNFANVPIISLLMQPISFLFDNKEDTEKESNQLCKDL